MKSRDGLRFKLKLIPYKTIFVPTLFYGFKSWAIFDKYRSMIASGGKCLLKVRGKINRNKIGNRNMTDELDQQPVINEIGKKKLKWC